MHGIFGFSQGANMASLLAAEAVAGTGGDVHPFSCVKQAISMRFAWLLHGFYARKEVLRAVP